MKFKAMNSKEGILGTIAFLRGRTIPERFSCRKYTAGLIVFNRKFLMNVLFWMPTRYLQT